jgi:hypothetical protein
MAAKKIMKLVGDYMEVDEAPSAAEPAKAKKPLASKESPKP